MAVRKFTNYLKYLLKGPCFNIGSDSPAPPDPNAMAASQQTQNRQTAAQNAQFNQFTSQGPTGSVGWTNTGTSENPNYVQTTTLSPEQQQLYNTQMQGQNTGAQMGNANLSNTENALGHGAYNPGDQQAQQQALLAQMQPDLTQNTNALETQLANQGLAPGTQAYETAMSHNGVANNNAILQSITGAAANAGLQQGIQNSYQNQALSNQNGLNALGGNVTMPTQTGNTGAGVSGAPNIASMIEQNYQAQSANANANQASKNGLLGAGMGAGAKVAGAYMGG